MSEATVTRTNPYVGPRAFQPGEVLYGRETELNNLLDLFIAERIVLLYSPSGAGKTSLVQAGLIPRLQAEGFRVRLPVVRVNLELPRKLCSDGTSNRYVFSTLSSLEEGRASPDELANEQLARLTLVEYLEAMGREEGENDNEVLIFDQFEEILTLDPTDGMAKEAFLAQVGTALRDRRRWALFVMREDYVASLDPYVSLIPTRLSTTFRLDLLGPEAARQAVCFPARDAGVTVTEAAATRIVDDLRRVRVQRPGGSVEELGPHIEPVQLQVVCRQLWERPRPDPAEITEDDVVKLGNVDSALADFYVQQVSAIARTTGTPERSIRDWFDQSLISEQGFRTQVLVGPDGQGGDTSEVVGLLLKGHLVRAEKRRGATWYELAHDRLIAPIQASNRAWREQHLSTLQRQAALWQGQDRQEGFLLSGEALDEAERWARDRASELSPVETDFLVACRQARAAVERERRSARRFRRLTIGLAILVVLAISTSVLAWSSNERAKKERTQATARQLAAHVFSKLGERLDLSLLLDVEALRGRSTPETRSALLTDLGRAPQLSTFLHSPRALLNVVFSPDGRLVAAGRDDGRIQLWDAETKRALVPLVAHNGLVGGLAISRDGRFLASASDDKTVILWDLPARRQVATLTGHRDLATSVAFSPDGRTLASGSVDGTVMLWSVPTGQPLITLVGHTDVVTTVAFSPDGQTVASGGNDKAVILWSPRSLEPLATLAGHAGAVRAVAFSPDGARLASGSNDQTVMIWDAPSRTARMALTGHSEFVRGLAFNSDGSRLASASEDGSVILWDPTTGRAFGRPLVGHRDFVTGVAFGPGGGTLVSSSIDHSAILWDLNREHPLGDELVRQGEAVTSVAFSPDGSILASGSVGGTVVLADVQSRQPIVTLAGNSGGVTSVAFDAAGGMLAAGTDSGAVILWDVPSRQVVAVLTGHTGGVNGVALSPDGAALASGDDNGSLVLWDTRTREPVATLFAGAAAVRSVAYSPDAKTVAAGTDAGTVTLWDTATRQVRATLPRRNGEVRTLAFSRDGRQLASGGQDGTIIMWDPRTSRPRDLPLAGHAGPLTGVSFSADRKTLASSSEDGTVILWDIQWYPRTRLFLGQPLSQHRGAVTSVAFATNGTTLASGGRDATVVLWDTDTASWQRRACSVANRNLLEKVEWDQFIGPGRDYRRTCPEFPAA